MFQAGIFKGKTALVTGGGSGIGFEIARQLLQYGAELYISSRKPERLEAAAEKLREYGPCHSDETPRHYGGSSRSGAVHGLV